MKSTTAGTASNSPRFLKTNVRSDGAPGSATARPVQASRDVASEVERDEPVSSFAHAAHNGLAHARARQAFDGFGRNFDARDVAVMTNPAHRDTARADGLFRAVDLTQEFEGNRRS